MKKIILWFLIVFGLLFAFADTVSADVIDLSISGNGGNESTAVRNNDKLQDFHTDSFIDVSGNWGERWLFNTLVRIARDMKNLFYAIATVYFLIIVLRLIFASNTEEELWKFKKGIVWITIGLIVMQIAFAFTKIMFDQGISARLGASLIEHLVWPMIALIQTIAAVFFLAVAIFAFYRLITANGNEEAVKSGKMTILYAIIGFMILRFARAIVEAFYGHINCESFSLGFVTIEGQNCVNEVNISEGTDIIITVLNYFNGFVAIVVMIMLIYAGAQILLSGWDEEKISKGKKSIIYIAIGMFLLAFNYLLLTFFLVPEVTI